MAVTKKSATATKKSTATSTKKSATAAKSSARFSLIDELQQSILEIATVNKSGEVQLKKSELKAAVEAAFEKGALAAARGERVRFPIIGILARKDVEARKAGKGTNPFTGEEMVIAARPASKKPRWSFPKVVKDLFAEKKNWK